MEHLRAPDTLDVNAKNLSLVWKRWKEELLLYVDLAMAGKQESQKCKLSLYLIGREGREIYETMQLTGDEKDRKLDEIIKAFDSYCNIKTNETVERYKFFTRNQEPNEPLEKYVTDLKILAATCNFLTLQESLIRDRIVCGINDSRLRERLLRESDLDLTKCIQTCKAAEISKEQIKTLEAPAMVMAVKQQQHRFKKPQWKQAQDTVTCKYCGTKHKRSKEKCPAYGKKCLYCKKMNHFAKCCLKRNQSQKKVHCLAEDMEDNSDDDNYEEIQSITLAESEEVNKVTESP
ncbi:uncharacterized protein LOC144353175 [Saccoglossus kowalevskii]